MIAARLSCAFAIICAVLPGPALAQSSAHIAQVDHVLKGTQPYAVKYSTNNCPALDVIEFGWPKGLVLNCEYKMHDSGLNIDRTAVAYLLDIPAAKIALWIETACAKLVVAPDTCFDAVLKDATNNSGLMFAVSGNVMEDMEVPGHFKNYFFRNGVTTSFKAGVNGSAAVMTLDDQQALTLLPTTDARAIATGKARFWSTLPVEFALYAGLSVDAFPLDKPKGRQDWLNRTQTEMLAALAGADNRLLDAWICANAAIKFHTVCKGHE